MRKEAGSSENISLPKRGQKKKRGTTFQTVNINDGVRANNQRRLQVLRVIYVPLHSYSMAR
jgi:hypothetical protein